MTEPTTEVTEVAKPTVRKRHAAPKAKAKGKSKGKGKQKNGPKVTGVGMRTRMVRVSADFADWLDNEAKRAGVNRTTASQTLYECLS